MKFIKPPKHFGGWYRHIRFKRVQEFSNEYSDSQDLLVDYPIIKKLSYLYYGTLLLVSLILVVVFQKVEYDTFTYYASKVELEKAGFSNVFLNSVQEYLPIGWTKIQFLWADLVTRGKNCVNFLTALILLVAIWNWEKNLRMFLILLVCSNEIFFVQSSGYKADSALASLAFLLILVHHHLVQRRKYFLLVLISMLIMSIKWTGLLIVGPFWILLIAEKLFRRVKFSLKIPFASLGEKLKYFVKILGGILLLFIVFRFLNLSLYWKAFSETGTFTPLQSFETGTINHLQSFDVSKVNLSLENTFRGFPQYLMLNTVESFEPIWSLAVAHGVNLNFLNHITFGAKTSVSLAADQTYGFGNMLTVFGFTVSLFYIFSNSSKARYFSTIAVAGTLVSLSAYPTLPILRYFTPFVLLSYYPLAHWLANGFRRMFREHQYLRNISLSSLVAFGILSTSYYVTFDWHRNLVSIVNFGGPIAPLSIEGLPKSSMPSVLLPLENRKSEQLFRGWSGYQTVYDFLKISEFDRRAKVGIVFDSRFSNQNNYTYPFIHELNIRNKEFDLYDLSKMGELITLCQIPGDSAYIAFGNLAIQKLKESEITPAFEYSDGTIAVALLSSTKICEP